MNTGTSASEPTPKGVIWLTGHSSAGKTTLGRIIVSQLSREGQALFLDGDDLRGIFGGKWGYSDSERRELARVYFRLCSYLVAQQRGTIVIAAAAMYEDVFEWFRENVPGGMLIYLSVPEDVRRQRDAGTKGVYTAEPSERADYETPNSADLVLANPDGADLDAIAERVIQQFRTLPDHQADRGKNAHWDSFYRETEGAQQPSPFGRVVGEDLVDSERNSVLEVGCGNGRDSAHFSRLGLSVSAIDASAAAIEACQRIDEIDASFTAGLVDEVSFEDEPFDAIYSRFVLHAMTLEEEIAFLETAAGKLKPGGRLYIECRSIEDPLARKGKVLSPTERVHGHYRRFIVARELEARARAAGFAIESMQESNGLAIHGDDDPVVIQLVAATAE